MQYVGSRGPSGQLFPLFNLSGWFVLLAVTAVVAPAVRCGCDALGPDTEVLLPLAVGPSLQELNNTNQCCHAKGIFVPEVNAQQTLIRFYCDNSTCGAEFVLASRTGVGAGNCFWPWEHVSSRGWGGGVEGSVGSHRK